MSSGLISTCIGTAIAVVLLILVVKMYIYAIKHGWMK